MKKTVQLEKLIKRSLLISAEEKESWLVGIYKLPEEVVDFLIKVFTEEKQGIEVLLKKLPKEKQKEVFDQFQAFKKHKTKEYEADLADSELEDIESQINDL